MRFRRNIILTCALLVTLCNHTRAEDAPTIDIKKDVTTDAITIDGKPFTELIKSKTEAYGDIPRPFLYPIIGPTGAEMTRNYPMREGARDEASDHPHHRSLWFAHGNVNGVDYWTQGKGKGTILSWGQDPDNRVSVDQASGKKWLVDFNTWIDPNGVPVLSDKSTYSFELLDDGSRVIDIAHAMTPMKDVEQVVFGDTKEGTMAIRSHPALRLKGEVATGKAINSEGDKDGDVWGKRANWVAYWGVIDGKTCGFAIFDHPTNLRHPTWWHARDYGLVAANPFGIHDFEKGQPKGAGDYTLKQDETLSLRYRFVFFAGTAEEADIAGKYEQWVKETTDTKANAGDWTPLFNGKDLTGWSAKPGGQWSVVDGTIVGTSEAAEKRHGLLVSDKAYGDFEAKLKFKVTEGNSGFYFRSTPVDNAVGIKGFQAEVDTTVATGGLYETMGRAWVKKPEAEQMKKLYTPGEWSDMTVYAKGGTIRVSVNGEQVVELENDKGATEGHFALQLHGGQKMDVGFKDIYIREIKAD